MIAIRYGKIVVTQSEYLPTYQKMVKSVIFWYDVIRHLVHTSDSEWRRRSQIEREAKNPPPVFLLQDLKLRNGRYQAVVYKQLEFYTIIGHFLTTFKREQNLRIF